MPAGQARRAPAGRRDMNLMLTCYAGVKRGHMEAVQEDEQ